MHKKLPKRIVFLGASSVHGWGDVTKGGFCGRFKTWYEAKKPYSSVFNLGIPGNSILDMHKRLSEIKERRPHLVIIQTGSNDCRRVDSEDNIQFTPLYDYKEHLKELIEDIEGFAPVIVLGIFPIIDSKTRPVKWAKDFYLLHDILEYERTAKQLCEEIDVPYIEIMSDWLKQGYSNWISDDGLHANGYGHQAIFDKLKFGFLEAYGHFQENSSN